MVSFTQSLAATAAFVCLSQLCPAPIVPVITIAVEMGTAAAWVGAAGGIAGGAASTALAIEGAKNKKRDVASPSEEVSQPFFSRIKQRQVQNELAWEECHDDLAGVEIGITSPAQGSILATGLPATCMTLATVVTGEYDLGNPVPEGTDSILFSGLSDDQIVNLQDALNALGN